MSVTVGFVLHGATVVSDHDAAVLVGSEYSGLLQGAYFAEVVLALTAVIEVLVVFESRVLADIAASLTTVVWGLTMEFLEDAT